MDRYHLEAIDWYNDLPEYAHMSMIPPVLAVYTEISVITPVYTSQRYSTHAKVDVFHGPAYSYGGFDPYGIGTQQLLTGWKVYRIKYRRNIVRLRLPI